MTLYYYYGPTYLASDGSSSLTGVSGTGAVGGFSVQTAADGSVGVRDQTTHTIKSIDTSHLLNGSGVAVERQRVAIGDPSIVDNLANVATTNPTSTAGGMVIRVAANDAEFAKIDTNLTTVNTNLGTIQSLVFPVALQDYNFLTSTSLSSTISFSRASVANYFDGTGTMQQSASGAARLDYGQYPQSITNWIPNSSMSGVVVTDGVELVTNGSFALNPLNASQNTLQNGWEWSVAGGTSTVTWSTGAVTIAPDGTNNARIDTSITTVVNASYILTCDVTTTLCNLSIGTTQGSGGIINANTATGTGQRFQFTATTTTTWIRFDRSSSGNSIIANVSVQTAGSLPTDWTSSLGGLTQQIIASGTDSGGRPYVDLRFSGTTTSTALTLNFFPNTTTVSAASTQTWTLNAWLSYVNGSTTNVTSFMLVRQDYNIADSYIGGSSATFTPTSTAIQIVCTGSTTTTTAYTYGYIKLNFSSAVAVDITLRIAAPQLECAAFPSTFVSTSTGSVTQGATQIGLLVEESRTNNVRNPRCEGAAIADGVELITNGTLSSSTGWTTSVNGGTGSVTFGTNNATITGDGTNAALLTQSITTVSGHAYFVAVTVTTNPVTVIVGTAQGGTTLANQSLNAYSSSQVVMFTASGTTTWVGFQNVTTNASTVSAISTQYAGAVPTYWSAGAPAGVGWQVTATGTNKGLPFVRIRRWGVPNTTGAVSVNYEVQGSTGLTTSENYTQSIYLALVAGSFTNISRPDWWGQVRNSSNSVIQDSQPPLLFYPNAFLTRFYNVQTTPSTGSTPFNISGHSILFYVVAAGTAVDFTVDFAGPQVEVGGAFPTSLIYPTAGVPGITTRSADSASVTASTWYNTTTGTLYAEFDSAAVGITSRNTSLAGFWDGGGTNIVDLFMPSAGSVFRVTTSGSNVLYDNGGGSFSAYATNKIAAYYTATIAAKSLNGSSLVTGTPSGSLPTGLTTLYLGSYSSGGVSPLCGHLRRFRYWSLPLASNDLQSITGNSYDDTTLDLNFITNQYAINDPRISWSRGSNATYFDSTGAMQLAASNQPRIDYDPVSLTCLGLLTEPSRTNSIPTSNTTSPGFASVASTDITALYSAATLWKATINTSNMGAYTSISLSAGSTYVLSAWVWLPTGFAGGAPRLDFDVGALGTGGSVTKTLADLTKTNQWQRIYSIAVTGTGASSTFNWVMRCNGDTSSGAVFYWTCPQSEVGTYVTSYIPTTGSSTTRSADNHWIWNTGWLNASTQSIAVEFSRTTTVADGTSHGIGIAAITDTSNTDFFNLYDVSRTVGLESSTYISSTLTNSTNNGLPITDTNTHKYAFAFSTTGTAAMSHDGGTVYNGTVTAYSALQLDRIMIGQGRTQSSAGGAHIRRIRYWGRVLSSTELQTVST